MQQSDGGKQEKELLIFTGIDKLEDLKEMTFAWDLTLRNPSQSGGCSGKVGQFLQG